MSNPSLAYNEPSNEQITVESLFKLATTVDLFEQYSRPHASQIARLAEALALRIGISGSDLNTLKIAALMHDVGEMIMDSPALRKGGIIDFKHKIELWRHPIIGEQQLAKRELPRQAQLLVRWHHEWWNGSGYPDMLSKETIPIGARILRLVDTYDALTADRPYREAFSLEQAQSIIEKSAGVEFDPYLVKIFLDILSEISTPVIPKQSLSVITEPLPVSSVSFDSKESQMQTSEIQPSEVSQDLAIDTDSQLENTESPVLEPLTTLENPENQTSSPTEEVAPISNYDTQVPQEETVSLVVSDNNLETEDLEPKADLGTQPLFVLSSDPTSVSNTSYLLEYSFREPMDENINENANDLSNKSEEILLDKSQENVENKSE